MHRRAPLLVTAVTIAAAFVIGCPDKKATPSRDAGSDAAIGDAAIDAAGPEAANEGLVRRYEDETPVDHVPLAVKATSARAVTAYPKGNEVATLQQGAAVVKLAERNGYFRVTFADDPKVPSLRKMGWVARFAFDEPTGAKKVTMPRCPTTMGIQVIVLDDGDKGRCAYECGEDRECTGGGTCEAAPLVPASGEMLPVPNYTTVCTPPDVDGGADAGKPIYFGTQRTNAGKCPRFFGDAPKIGDLCYRTCKVDTDCPEPGACLTVPTGPGAKTAKLCVMH